MKLYYITTLEKAHTLTSPWHGKLMDTGKHMIAVQWKDEIQEMQWSNDPEVTPLPHPIFESDQPLTDEHVDHLKSLGVQKGHNVHHAIKAVAQHDPWMRLRVL